MILHSSFIVRCGILVSCVACREGVLLALAKLTAQLRIRRLPVDWSTQNRLGWHDTKINEFSRCSCCAIGVPHAKRPAYAWAHQVYYVHTLTLRILSS